MNFKNPNPVFCVYVHTSPKGKRYVGITSQKPSVRWGYNGKGYVDNKHFYSAILLYGWENFKHEIVAEGLDLKDASELECNLISEYDTMNPNYGYNQTTGGNWSLPSEEVRKKLSISLKRVWSDPDYHKRMCEIQKQLPHKPLTEEHKRHISESQKGVPSPLKGRTLSEERKMQMRGRTPWNKGKTKETDIRIMQISSSLKGREFTPQALKNMSESRKRLYKDGYSPIWINNGSVERQVDSSIGDQIPEGFSIGRLPTVYVTNGNITKKVSKEELDTYISNGWSRGKSSEIHDSIKRSLQKYVWRYGGLEFESAVRLAEYLRENGYPKIVGSTITNLYNKGFSKSKIYYSLEGKITREEVNNASDFS